MITSTINSYSPHPSTYSMAKRLLDIIGSLIGLLILAIIFLPIAIAIKSIAPAQFYTAKRATDSTDNHSKSGNSAP